MRNNLVVHILPIMPWELKGLNYYLLSLPIPKGKFSLIGKREHFEKQQAYTNHLYSIKK